MKNVETELWGEGPAYLAQRYEEELLQKYGFDVPELLKRKILDTEDYITVRISSIGRLQPITCNDETLERYLMQFTE